MAIENLIDMANKVSSLEDFDNILCDIMIRISSGEIKKLNSYEVIDGCESFASRVESWCEYRGIPYDGTPTWSLVAWIILAGVLND